MKSATEVRHRRVHSAEFKNLVAREFLSRVAPARALARKHGVNATSVRLWARNLERQGDASKWIAKTAAARPTNRGTKPPRAGHAVPGKKGIDRPLRRAFTDAMKLSAVKRVLAGEVRGHVAHEIGVYDSTLGMWVENVQSFGTVGHKRGPKNVNAQTRAVIVREATVEPSRTDGRLQGYIKGERAQLLQVIGMQTVEIIRLKERER